MNEITKIEAKDEHVILVGDFNKHVGNIIRGNHDKVTSERILVRDFLQNSDYVLLNSTTKVIGGLFTREDPSDPKDESKKSCINLIMMSKELVPKLCG